MKVYQGTNETEEWEDNVGILGAPSPFINGVKRIKCNNGSIWGALKKGSPTNHVGK